MDVNIVCNVDEVIYIYCICLYHVVRLLLSCIRFDQYDVIMYIRYAQYMLLSEQWN